MYMYNIYIRYIYNYTVVYYMHIDAFSLACTFGMSRLVLSFHAWTLVKQAKWEPMAQTALELRQWHTCS
jgi:hypothetical protein